jgi:hypothetical protein
LVSGRICPESGSPAIECAGRCGSERCAYRRMPDRPIVENMKEERRGGGYSELKTPRDLKTARDFDWMGAARMRMFCVMPETEPDAAARYLFDAAFALFVGRALQGITKSNSKGLSKHLAVLLKKEWNEASDLGLELMIARLKEKIPNTGEVDAYANRFKAAYWLKSASSLLKREAGAK